MPLLPGFFQGTEMPTAGWWEALWPDPAGVLAGLGVKSGMDWHPRPREETTVLGEPRGPKTELRLSPEQTIESVAPAGLKLAQLVEVPPYHYGVLFERSSR
jgi:hypothetical protein